MAVVSTIPGKCKRCYSCVRNCPVKAVRVKEGQAEVIEERCIACGTCVRVCTQNAKAIESHIPIAQKLLADHGLVVAAPAPSFPAAFADVDPGQVVAALKQLGFSHVMEVAFGAQLLSNIGYPNLIRETKGRVITSPCPAIVTYIEKYHPSLIPALAPLVSPMIAMGRVIKQALGEEARIVFIGPCIAKKQEMADENVRGVIDAVLTYLELKDMFDARNIIVSEQKVMPLDGPRADLARCFPISGGLLKSAAMTCDVLDSDILVTEGKDRTLEIVREIEKDTIATRFFDLLFCEGCISGPVMDNKVSGTESKDIISKFVKKHRDPQGTREDVRTFRSVNLEREFSNKKAPMWIPTEAELKEILARVGKTNPEDELNCGACGYLSCRDKATAVYQGLAEAEMCLPYLIDELQKTQESLIQSEKMVTLGEIAAGIAHEINNPLAGVLVYAKLMRKNLRDNTVVVEEFDSRLQSIEKETERCSRIIKNLLDFSRQSVPTIRPVDMNKKLENAITLLEHQAELSNVRIARNMARNLPSVHADPDQYLQVFINIIINAIQAMPDGGTLTITSEYIPRSDEVVISFTDTGVGIPKENMKKLFIPFFTTKEKGKGVGLGLPVCYGIVQRHGGKIEVESTVGAGATFTIRQWVHHD